MPGHPETDLDPLERFMPDRFSFNDGEGADRETDGRGEGNCLKCGIGSGYFA